MRIGGREEDDDGARYVVGEGDGGAAPFSLSLKVEREKSRYLPQINRTTGNCSTALTWSLSICGNV